MKTNKILMLGAALALFFTSSPSMAELSAEELARLGTSLTPFGAEMAGNAQGTIPAWEGGIRSAAEAGYPDFKPSGHHPDPYKDDAPLFVITSENMEKHADKLTAGQKALLQAYPGFSMKVYPSHRSAAFPRQLYDATKKTAATARLEETGNGVLDTAGGIPFPIPKNGLEAIWNVFLRFQAYQVTRNTGQAAVLRNGDFTVVRLLEDFIYIYHDPAVISNDNLIFKVKQRVTSPPRVAGGIILVHETLNQAKEPRRGWKYNPGQRRVRRAPNLAFDTPATASDGQMAMDQYEMYNGSPQRYNWELVGKKEIYVPYNSYRLHSNDLKYTDIIRPLHINTEHARYELHRVWVVECKLKEGMRHIYKRRTFYMDEDSWMPLHIDQYDNRDQLWRVSEAHVINYYEVPVLWTTLNVHYDLQSGRYFLRGLDNEEGFTMDFSPDLSHYDFSIASLRRDGRR
uniref:Outer membrane lipoprotein-sorting protein n=1 Tax=Candidatus Kentrum sp. FW TaxID=2126338 RepID=A0A450TKW6_9GAMM|nr:MAG: Protein of unknown function (DUF1329) [Candidatus Kentron sp. FW]VFJ68276.1 MAG: Protein of unknown function (DUF1329) [Candidatus Kentron sp. FW]